MQWRPRQICPGRFASGARRGIIGSKACNIVGPAIYTVAGKVVEGILRHGGEAVHRRATRYMQNSRSKFQAGPRFHLKQFGLMQCALMLAAMAIVATGCSHRVVASAGEHTVKIFPDQATYDKVAKMKSQGGAMGMLGGIGANLAAKEVDDQTPVRIVTTNDEGSVVEVTDGPFKGVTGFVPRQNVN